MLTLLLSLQVLLPVPGIQQQNPVISLLEDSNPAVRKSAIDICLAKRVTQSVVKLVELTADPDAEVKAAAIAALNKWLGVELPDSAAWSAWLKGDEGKKYVDASRDNPNLGAVWARLDTLQRKMEDDKNQLETKTRDGRNEIKYLTAGMAAVGVLFMLIMFYFVGHVSSRVKEWKELVIRGESTIKKGEEITRRTDQIIAELEAKKAEIMGFVEKVKDDNRVEFERYCEMLQKNLEHEVREQVMIYRQKAEKELEQTLADFLKRNRVTT